MLDTFARRHLGPQAAEVAAMLKAVGYASLDAMTGDVIPPAIQLRRALDLPAAKGEREALDALRAIMDQNKVFKSYLGQGYYDTITPPVIQRNILENPGWYTAYTPYQAEIAQGRLEALLNFQTMIADLTGLAVANASLLDEATSAAEAMTHAARRARQCRGQPVLRLQFVSSADARCHPHPRGAAGHRGHRRRGGRVQSRRNLLRRAAAISGHGRFSDRLYEIHPRPSSGRRQGRGGRRICLHLRCSNRRASSAPTWPSAPRSVSGVPLGYGGPHAGFFATRDELKRHMPGRLIGVSHDAQGRPAMRLALQTREQHIRRDKATSNICTAQVLLAVMASMYAVYHGPEGTQGHRGAHRAT